MNSIAYHYHQRTKYDPETIAQKGKSLDWSKQPTPYKEYKIGHSFDLKPYLSPEKNGDAQPYDEEWLRLSLLLLCSYGLTAQLQTIYGDPIYLRSAPSAGGTTAVFERSAWRYEDRAYRRVFLDTGHLLGNIELAAASNGYKAHFLGGFCDEAINDILYLDGETESAIAIVSLLDANKDSATDFFAPTALPSAIVTEYPKIADGALLHYLHQKTNIDTEPEKLSGDGSTQSLEDKYNFPFCSKVSTISQNTIDWGTELSELENTILQRRSTRRYTGENLTLDELKSLLNFTYQPQDYVGQGLDGSPDYFALDLVETFIAVSGVEDLEAGCYYYAPQAQELRQIRFKNFRRELHSLCLGQELGRDAAAIVFQTADLTKAIAKYGDRAYRYLHLDAGHLGQRLNLAAIRLKLGVSGIGGFFDDRVNQVLDIPQEEAVIYLTTLGRP